jgi:hypothetical protein
MEFRKRPGISLLLIQLPTLIISALWFLLFPNKGLSGHRVSIQVPISDDSVFHSLLVTSTRTCRCRVKRIYQGFNGHVAINLNANCLYFK